MKAKKNVTVYFKQDSIIDRIIEAHLEDERASTGSSRDALLKKYALYYIQANDKSALDDLISGIWNTANRFYSNKLKQACEALQLEVTNDDR